MIYQRKFIKELSFTAVGIFVVLLAILLCTQVVNLLGRAADGRVAIDAVGTLIGFWMIGLTPLLLILTAFISLLTVLTRYWRDSEMAVWRAGGLSLNRWLRPVAWFVVPFSLLIAVLTLAVLPWAESRSQEYAQILKQQQALSMVEQGVFRSVGRDRVYFIERFDSEQGIAKNLFIREQLPEGKSAIITAQSGNFKLDDPKERTLTLLNGRRYVGTPGQADYEVLNFDKLDLLVQNNIDPIKPSEARQAIPTSTLWGSAEPRHQSELMWRLSLPLSILILGLLAVPLSYFNPRAGHSYNLILAVVLFLIYQNGLTLLRRAVEDGLPFWLGLLPMHVLMLLLGWLLLRYRNQPSGAFWPTLKAALKGNRS